VEEQFYIIFPIFLFSIIRWGNARTFSALVLLGLFSFALNVALVDDFQSLTFYLPPTRLWEFSLGGAIAYIKLNIHGSSPKDIQCSKNIMASTGLLLLLLASDFPKGKASRAGGLCYPPWERP